MTLCGHEMHESIVLTCLCMHQYVECIHEYIFNSVYTLQHVRLISLQKQKDPKLLNKKNNNTQV